MEGARVKRQASLRQGNGIVIKLVGNQVRQPTLSAFSSLYWHHTCLAVHDKVFTVHMLKDNDKPMDKKYKWKMTSLANKELRRTAYTWFDSANK